MISCSNQLKTSQLIQPLIRINNRIFVTVQHALYRKLQFGGCNALRYNTAGL